MRIIVVLTFLHMAYLADPKTLTTSNGTPIDNNQNSLTVGYNGPTLLQDFALIDKLANFNRERIPERVVHAKGAGAHGFFKVTDDITKYTKAVVFEKIGKETPIFMRFSTVGGEKGSADTERDPRGFAIKFYTEDGNWDMVGNNTPVFFIRDAIKFPDFVHTQKRSPVTNLKDPNMMWDFFSRTPESCHQVTRLFSSLGTPNGFRHMDGFSSHTFKFVNKDGEVTFVKMHFLTDQGVKNLSAKEASDLKSSDPDYSTRDLYQSIEKGNYPSWSFYIQAMPEKDAETYKWNILDVTKTWPEADYPLIRVGTLTLNKNPRNFHAEVEQAAFAPAHLIPGIEPSNDKLLQGRLFAYPDTQRHRLGGNYLQIPINCPYRARVFNNQRDGNFRLNDNTFEPYNYEPNSYQTYNFDPNSGIKEYELSGKVGKHNYIHPNDDYKQAGDLYLSFPESERAELVNNISESLKLASQEVRERQINIFYKANTEYGRRIANKLGMVNLSFLE